MCFQKVTQRDGIKNKTNIWYLDLWAQIICMHLQIQHVPNENTGVQ